jgi:hypothetical protein
MQLEATVFGVLHPEPAKMVLRNTRRNHLLEAVHEPVCQFW